MLARHPQTFAAALPLAGTGSTGGASEIGKYYTETPIWTVHGDADTTLSVEGTRQMVAAIEAAGGDITYTEFKGGTHDIWQQAAVMPGVVDWLFAHTKNGETPVEPPVNPAKDPDVNGDGSVTVEDALVVLQQLLADPVAVKVDLNEDGRTSLYEVLAILKLSVAE